LQGVPFLEYYNLLVKEVNMNAKSNLITLREKALESLVAALDNDNTALRLKVAMWILKEAER
jgi:hypothetical protein